MARYFKVDYHDTFLRVRYSETDRMDVVYHTRYLEYFEVGRAEYMRACGAPYSSLEAKGIRLAVVEATAKFRSPARYDDEVRIRTRISQVRKTRICFEYVITRRGAKEILVEGSTWLACIDDNKRPSRLPVEVINALSANTVS